MSPDDDLAFAFLESHPREAALAIEELPEIQAVAVLRAARPPIAAAVLREMACGSAAECLARLSGAEAAAIVGALPADESAGLLRRMLPDGRDRILAELPAGAGEPVARALRFPEGTAGSLMDPSILDLPDDIPVGEAQQRVRRAARDLLYYLYVVDRDRRLVGVLDIPELMTAPPADGLRGVMHAHVDRLSAWAPPHIIREHPGWRSYHAMPVVDEQDRLLGAIRYQTLRRLEQDAPAGGPPPVTVTALALGELFQIGVTAMVGSLASVAASRGTAVRRADIDDGGSSEDRRG